MSVKLKPELGISDVLSVTLVVDGFAGASSQHVRKLRASSEPLPIAHAPASKRYVKKISKVA